jgi:zinc-ribbon domain
MFCPKCATQNQDHTKFCRHCGMDLRAVGLALNAQLMPQSEDGSAGEKNLESQKRQGDGIHNLVQGVLLSMTSVLLGVFLALFSNRPNWGMIWFIFCGWLAVWGAIEMAFGISNLIQARIMRRGIERLAGLAITPATPDTQRMPETADAREISSPPSVTEHTTAPLSPPGSHF